MTHNEYICPFSSLRHVSKFLRQSHSPFPNCHQCFSDLAYPRPQVLRAEAMTQLSTAQVTPAFHTNKLPSLVSLPKALSISRLNA